MKGADAIAEILKREGVELVFCFPYTPILDALARAGIRPVVARQERVAENMADGYSRASNGERLGVVTVQQSAGVENGFAGIAQAFTDSSPILFLPGHPGSQLVGMPPTFDARTNYQATTKWADLIPSAAAVPGRMRRPFTALRTGRPRPVLLEVPVDVAQQELAGELDYRPVAGCRAAADPGAVERAVQVLLQAERPLVWAGQGILWAQASLRLEALAERLALPVMTTLLGKSGMNERHPLSVGTGGFAITGMAAEALARCDVLLALGASLTRDFTAPPILPGKRIIHNTNDPSDLNVHFHAEVALLGDAALVIDQLLAELARRDARPRRARAEVEGEIAQSRERFRTRFARKLASDQVPINPYRAIGDFMAEFDPASTIVTHDSGNPRDQLVPLYEAVAPRGYLGWGHSTQLGFGLGAAMGAKLARPEKLVAHFMGDAAFGMVGLDIETAVREHIPILTVLLNNSAMGNYEKNIPVAAERYHTKFLSGSYSAVARGLGAWSERVERPEEVRAAFARARAVVLSGRPALLELITGEEPEIAYWHTYPELMGKN